MAKRMSTAYEIMGVSRTCNKSELRQAYNALVKRAHPDKGGDEEQFQRVQKAYQNILRDLSFSSHRREKADPLVTSHREREEHPKCARTGQIRRENQWTPPSVRNGDKNTSAKSTFKAMEAKSRGNRSFAEGRYEDAVQCYTEALAWLPGEASIHCNRSAAWYEQGEWEKALHDATTAARINPRYVKAQYRSALAFSALKRHRSALARMRIALELSLCSDECKQALVRIERACAKDHLYLNLLGHSGIVQDVAWRPRTASSGQKRPIVATSSFDGTVRIWCGDSGILMHDLKGHTDKVTTVKWSGNGELLISLSLDKTARIWKFTDEENVTCASIFSGHMGRPTNVCFATCKNGENVLATSSTDSTARIWSLSKTQKVQRTLSGHRQMVTDIDFSSRSNLLVTASGDSSFKLWDISRGVCTQTVDWGSGAVNHCMFVRVEDEELLVTCHFDVKFERSRILLWNMDGKSGWADGKLVAHVMHFEGFQGKITCIDATDFAGEAVLLAAGSSDGTVGVYDLTCKACMFDLVDQHVPLVGVSTSISALKFSPDGSKLATSGLDGKVHIWNSDDGSYHMTFNGHQDRVTSLCWSQDGNKLASCGYDQTAKVWKMPAAAHNL